jgi:hypothetical protein
VERTYVVECYWPGVTRPVYAETVTRAGAAARAFDVDGRTVRFLDSLLVPSDEAAYFRFASQSREDVEQVCVAAQLPFERILEYVAAPDTPAQGDRS